MLKLLYGNMPEKEWLDRMWLGKLHEVMDRYQPDMIWFDSWLDSIPEDYRQRFCADYLNRAQDWGKEVTYNPQDIRYTRSKDDLTLYAIVLGVPEPGSTVALTSVTYKPKNITLLGSDAKIAWEHTKEGIKITMPDKAPNEMAVAFRIDRSF